MFFAARYIQMMNTTMIASWVRPKMEELPFTKSSASSAREIASPKWPALKSRTNAMRLPSAAANSADTAIIRMNRRVSATFSPC